MHGNVYEWCTDRCKEDYNTMSHKTGENQERIIRGGSWNQAPFYCRSASRAKSNPKDKSNQIGFRVVFSFRRIF